MPSDPSDRLTDTEAEDIAELHGDPSELELTDVQKAHQSDEYTRSQVQAAFEQEGRTFSDPTAPGGNPSPPPKSDDNEQRDDPLRPSPQPVPPQDGNGGGVDGPTPPKTGDETPPREDTLPITRPGGGSDLPGGGTTIIPGEDETGDGPSPSPPDDGSPPSDDGVTGGDRISDDGPVQMPTLPIRDDERGQGGDKPSPDIDRPRPPKTPKEDRPPRDDDGVEVGITPPSQLPTDPPATNRDPENVFRPDEIDPDEIEVSGDTREERKQSYLEGLAREYSEAFATGTIEPSDFAWDGDTPELQSSGEQKIRAATASAATGVQINPNEITLGSVGNPDQSNLAGKARRRVNRHRIADDYGLATSQIEYEFDDGEHQLTEETQQRLAYIEQSRDIEANPDEYPDAFVEELSPEAYEVTGGEVSLTDEFESEFTADSAREQLQEQYDFPLEEALGREFQSSDIGEDGLRPTVERALAAEQVERDLGTEIDFGQGDVTVDEDGSIDYTRTGRRKAMAATSQFDLDELVYSGDHAATPQLTGEAKADLVDREAIAEEIQQGSPIIIGEEDIQVRTVGQWGVDVGLKPHVEQDVRQAERLDVRQELLAAAPPGFNLNDIDLAGRTPEEIVSGGEISAGDIFEEDAIERVQREREQALDPTIPDWMDPNRELYDERGLGGGEQEIPSEVSGRIPEGTLEAEQITPIERYRNARPQEEIDIPASQVDGDRSEQAVEVRLRNTSDEPIAAGSRTPIDIEGPGVERRMYTDVPRLEPGEGVDVRVFPDIDPEQESVVISGFGETERIPVDIGGAGPEAGIDPPVAYRNGEPVELGTGVAVGGVGGPGVQTGDVEEQLARQLAQIDRAEDLDLTQEQLDQMDGVQYYLGDEPLQVAQARDQIDDTSLGDLDSGVDRGDLSRGPQGYISLERYADVAPGFDEADAEQARQRVAGQFESGQAGVDFDADDVEAAVVGGEMQFGLSEEGEVKIRTANAPGGIEGGQDFLVDTFGPTGGEPVSEYAEAVFTDDIYGTGGRTRVTPDDVRLPGLQPGEEGIAGYTDVPDGVDLSAGAAAQYLGPGAGDLTARADSDLLDTALATQSREQVSEQLEQRYGADFQAGRDFEVTRTDSGGFQTELTDTGEDILRAKQSRTKLEELGVANLYPEEQTATEIAEGGTPFGSDGERFGGTSPFEEAVEGFGGFVSRNVVDPVADVAGDVTNIVTQPIEGAIVPGEDPFENAGQDLLEPPEEETSTSFGEQFIGGGGRWAGRELAQLPSKAIEAGEYVAASYAAAGSGRLDEYYDEAFGAGTQLATQNVRAAQQYPVQTAGSLTIGALAGIGIGRTRLGQGTSGLLMRELDFDPHKTVYRGAQRTRSAIGSATDRVEISSRMGAGLGGLEINIRDRSETVEIADEGALADDPPATPTERRISERVREGVEDAQERLSFEDREIFTPEQRDYYTPEQRDYYTSEGGIDTSRSGPTRQQQQAWRSGRSETGDMTPRERMLEAQRTEVDADTRVLEVAEEDLSAVFGSASMGEEIGDQLQEQLDQATQQRVLEEPRSPPGTIESTAVPGRPLTETVVSQGPLAGQQDDLMESPAEDVLPSLDGDTRLDFEQIGDVRDDVWTETRTDSDVRSDVVVGPDTDAWSDTDPIVDDDVRSDARTDPEVALTPDYEPMEEVTGVVDPTLTPDTVFDPDPILTPDPGPDPDPFLTPDPDPDPDPWPDPDPDPDPDPTAGADDRRRDEDLGFGEWTSSDTFGTGFATVEDIFNSDQ